MSTSDRSTPLVRAWLRRSTPLPPDAEQSVDEVMTALFQQTQVRPSVSLRWLRGIGGDTQWSPLLAAARLGVAATLVVLIGSLLAVGVGPFAPGASDPPPYAAIEGRATPDVQWRAADEVEQGTPPQVIGTGWGWRLRWKTNDDRLTGTDTNIQNYHQFLAGSATSGTLRSGIGRLTNEGGSWRTVYHGFSKPGESDWYLNHYVAYLTGAGGYEGLSAMILMTPVPGQYWRLDGVIAPGPLPEPPSSLEPPGAAEIDIEAWDPAVWLPTEMGPSEQAVIEELPPYAAISGKIWPAVSTHSASKDPEHPPPQTLWHDWTWTLRNELSDPRLDGAYETNQDYLMFDGEDLLTGTLRSGIGRLTNEGGSWTSEFHGFSRPGTSNYSGNRYVNYFTGEGGYEGLTAMLVMIPDGSYWAVDGVIGPGPMPEPPATLDLADAE